MATIDQFNKALTAKGIHILEIKQSLEDGVVKVVGCIVKKYTWDKDGKAYNQLGEREIELDIKL